jgi:hypothetical protein
LETGSFSGRALLVQEDIEMDLLPCFRRGLLAALVLTLAAGSALALPKSDSVVKVTASADKPDAHGKQTVTINVEVKEPYHIYANPIGNPDFVNNQTTVKVDAEKKPTNVKVDYPEGKVHKDKVVGDYKVYEGKITIKAHVERASGDTSPLQISIKVQACDETNCLLPATIKVSVP